MSFVVYRAPNPSTQPKPQTPLPDLAPDFAPEPEPEPRPAPPSPRVQRTLGAFASLPSSQMPAVQKPLVKRPHRETSPAQWSAPPSTVEPQSRSLPRLTAPRVAAARAASKPTIAAQPTTADYLRLAAFALAGGIIATLYVVLPLMVTLHAALPFLPSGVALFALALAVVALGEVAVVRVLLRTTPQRQTVEALPRRAPAFSGPFGFDVELSADGDEGLREFPSLGRGIPAGPDLLFVRVGSARWRNYQGPVALSAYLPEHVVYAQATILRAEDAPVYGRAQCILHLRLSGMSPEDERQYRAALA